MSRALRNPLLWVGLALAALGGGNWINGQMKLTQYRNELMRGPAPAWASSTEGFPHLTATTNAELLRPLRSSTAVRNFREAKRDFYQVVLSGGRVLTLVGLFILVIGLLWERRQRRHSQLPIRARRSPI
jgi:hypothetical protein